jgi:hypothetical protein
LTAAIAGAIWSHVIGIRQSGSKGRFENRVAATRLRYQVRRARFLWHDLRLAELVVNQQCEETQSQS